MKRKIYYYKILPIYKDIISEELRNLTYRYIDRDGFIPKGERKVRIPYELRFIFYLTN